MPGLSSPPGLVAIVTEIRMSHRGNSRGHSLASPGWLWKTRHPAPAGTTPVGQQPALLPALVKHLARKPASVPPHIDYLANRYAHEPYRQVLALLAADLALASRDDVVDSLLSRGPTGSKPALSTSWYPSR
jgi:hypothetical protein